MLVSVDYALIQVCGYLMTESLYTALLTLAVCCLVLATKRPGWGWWFGTGVAFGLATLCRPMGLLLAAVACFWAALTCGVRKKQTWQHGAALIAALLAVVSPWMVRNYQVHGVPTPMTVG
ncbi:MAG: hypothetical protein COT06_00495, partial [Syntrophobacteraceae bacterium CG07_land_8_20_14_0_80_61_8]